MRLSALFAAAALVIAAPSTAAKRDTTPLFTNDEPLDVTIAGSVRDVVRRASYSTEPKPSRLTANGETHEITLAARGLSRRNKKNCQFPPLRVEFAKKPPKGSLFRKQSTLKLVTHCRKDRGFDRFVLREYSAYRLLNVLTPNSLKVRLARMHYLDDDGDEIAERWGFFIEDIDDAARRMGGKEVTVKEVPSGAIDPRSGAIVSMFQYLIGNLDWDMTVGPAGEDCCHNSKLVGDKRSSREGLIPIPYDFDFSGLVYAPYSQPPDSLPVLSVRQRVWRGFCDQNEEVRRFFAEMLAARPQLEAELHAIEQLDKRDLKGLLEYVGDFYEDVDSLEEVDKRMLDHCRTKNFG